MLMTATAFMDAGRMFLVGCAVGALLIGFIHEKHATRRGERRRR